MYRSSRNEEEFEHLSESLVRESAPTALALIEHLYKRNRDSKFSDPETGRQRRMEQKMLTTLMNRVQDRSDESVEFCQLLAISENFVNNVFSDMLKTWSSDYLNGKLDDACVDLMFKGITVLYNCLFKNDNFVNTNLANFDLVEVVRPLLKSPESARSLQALLLMAFALDESQANLFLGESDIIRLLVDGLRESLKSKERSFETGNMVYSLPELVKCTQRLALNDVNKGLLMKFGVLPAVKTVLEASEPEDVGTGLELAFSLSFERDRKLKLQLGAEICEPVKRIAADAAKNQSMSQTLQGLLYNMGEKFTLKVMGGTNLSEEADDENESSPGDKTTVDTDEEAFRGGCDVVISYHPDQREFARKLRADLLTLGISVWDNVSDGRAGGLPLQAVREVTLKCRAFVVCLSRRYNDSNACRLEAEYARTANKLAVLVAAEERCRPTGWLTLLLKSGPMVAHGAEAAAEIGRRISSANVNSNQS